MNEREALLAQLREAIEPPAPAGTSPWLMVMALSLSALALLIWLRQRHTQREPWLRDALAELNAVADLPPEAAHVRLAKLLRRVAREYDRHDALQLSGETWLQALDELFDCAWFTEGAGRCFGDALYQPDSRLSVSSSRRLTQELRKQFLALARRPRSALP